MERWPSPAFLLRLRANDERCRGDKLALVVLSRSPASIGGVPVFANEPFGVRVVHALSRRLVWLSVSWPFRRLAKHLWTPRKSRVKVYVADFVRLDAQVGVVHAEQVPDVEMGIA